MDVSVPCLTLCDNVQLNKEQSATLAKRIRNNYFVHLWVKIHEFSSILLIFWPFRLVDNLPCATKFVNEATQDKIYEHGYRLGMYSKQDDQTFLNNHLVIRLYYHKESPCVHNDRFVNQLTWAVCFSLLVSDFYRVVGFEVEPKSIDSKRITSKDDGTCTIEAGKDMQRIDPKGMSLIPKRLFRYSSLRFWKGENKLHTTYEIEWLPSETRWASR